MVKSKKPLNERSSASDFGPTERLQHTSGLAYERTSKQLGSKKARSNSSASSRDMTGTSPSVKNSELK